MHHEKIVGFLKKKDLEYPSRKPFNPSELFPEYRWKPADISMETNSVYSSFRELLHKMEYDNDHFGTSSWNPFGEFIQPGQQVLIKPNMVLDVHEYGPAWDIFSVITHPSLVRAVVDYVVIALKGQGRILIGDAPLQSCDFDNLVNSYGYSDIIQFCQERGVTIELIDFRLHKSKRCAKVNLLEERKESDATNYRAVDLGTRSMLQPISHSFKNYRVTNYDCTGMVDHHNTAVNEYLIPLKVLEADVIINMPKPKTHRKIGITAALKNIVGINGHKDWLPHHRRGHKSSDSDEYLNPSFFKNLQTGLQEKVDRAGQNRELIKGFVLLCIKQPVTFLARLTKKDTYYEGSWWGNDTLWRTVVDLNRIVLYADKTGKIQDTVQRKVLTVGDMITSGEREGPLSPTTKKAGIIIAGTDSVLFDAAVAMLMGFDYKKIPVIVNSQYLSDLSLTSHSISETTFLSNTSLNGKAVDQINFNDTEKYCPSKGWAGHITMTDPTG